MTASAINTKRARSPASPISYDEKARTLTIAARQGSYPGMAASRVINIRWMTPGRALDLDGAADRTVTYRGKEMVVRR